MPRVLLADDDAAFRESLAATLERMPDVQIIGSVGDGHTAVAAAMDGAPDLVVIDYAMPGPNGGHAAAVIRQALPKTEVVILTGLPAGELDDLSDGVEVVQKGFGMEDALLGVLARQR